MDGPYKFRVKFEIGYGLLYTDAAQRAQLKEEFGPSQVREVVVLAHDAEQAVFQVQVSLRKEVLETISLSSKRIGAHGMRERKHVLMLSVEPLAKIL